MILSNIDIKVKDNRQSFSFLNIQSYSKILLYTLSNDQISFEKKEKKTVCVKYYTIFILQYYSFSYRLLFPFKTH